MEKDQKKAPLMPQEYSWARMIGIGLTVLSLGLAIAMIGYFLTQ